MRSTAGQRGLDTSQRIDLTAAAWQEIGALAPFALGKRCELALEASKTPAEIQGNADAIGDALRNLIENAIAHRAGKSA